MKLSPQALAVNSETVTKLSPGVVTEVTVSTRNCRNCHLFRRQLGDSFLNSTEVHSEFKRAKLSPYKEVSEKHPKKYFQNISIGSGDSFREATRCHGA